MSKLSLMNLAHFTKLSLLPKIPLSFSSDRQALLLLGSTVLMHGCLQFINEVSDYLNCSFFFFNKPDMTRIIKNNQLKLKATSNAPQATSPIR